MLISEVFKSDIIEIRLKYYGANFLQENMAEKIIGLDDSTIINSISGTNENTGKFTVHRTKPIKTRRYSIVHITVAGSEKEHKLIQKIYPKIDNEFNKLGLIAKYNLNMPNIYYLDFEQKIILMEDLDDGYIQGLHFSDDNENGTFFRENYNNILSSIAKFHGFFWENYDVFGKIGLDRRLESKENLLSFIQAMEKDFIKYRDDEKAGRIPKKWEIFENNMELKKLDYFQTAIEILKQEYIKYIDTRYNTGKNITIIHGDLHPGNIFLSKYNDRNIKFIDLEAVRTGLCTEDLAMFTALHIEPDMKNAKPLLDHYYQCLCEKVKDYTYKDFIDDYKISVMENMFFPIWLMKRGIYDFSMRDRAIKAFETII
jgi:tRNA A-37 threonylcarbamoyl transferase component Bud32